MASTSFRAIELVHPDVTSSLFPQHVDSLDAQLEAIQSQMIWILATLAGKTIEQVQREVDSLGDTDDEAAENNGKDETETGKSTSGW